MGVHLTKDSFDLGIVVADLEKALAFYRDTLGFKMVREMAIGDGAVIHWLQCGTGHLKVVHYPEPPTARPAPGGMRGGTGYRYWTMSVSNLAEVLASCRSAGYKVVIDQKEIRPGVTVGIVEDPEGNWVEMLEGNA